MNAIKNVFLFVNFEKEKIKEQITLLEDFFAKNGVGIFMSDEFVKEFADKADWGKYRHIDKSYEH